LDGGIVVGYLVCAVLSLLALVASASAATRLGAKRGAEFVLAVVTLWFGTILVPIHLLGVLNQLKPGPLGGASVVTSAAVFLASARGRSARAQLQDTAEQARATVDRALSLLMQIFRAGPLPIAALVALLFALGWTLVLTYLLPSDAWDAVWYHDLITGYVIQQHGYSEAHLVVGSLQGVNTYPRNCEMTSLWFVIFADRKFIELPSVIAAVPSALAIYCLCQRFWPANKPAAFIWAAAFVLLPGARLEMRTTYNDGQFAAFALTACYFASNAEMRPTSAIMSAVALGLTFGGKGQALLLVPPLALLTLVLLLGTLGRGRLKQALAVAAVGTAIILLLGGETWILNCIRHHNPVWPMKVKIGPVELPGLLDRSAWDENARRDLSRELFGAPQPGKDYPDTRSSSYGMWPLFVLPVALFGAAVAGILFALRLVLFGINRRTTRDTREILTLSALAALACFYWWQSTANWWARYNLPVVGIAVVLAHWVLHRISEWGKTSFGLASCAFITNVAMWWWSSPGWGPAGIVEGPADIVSLMKRPAIERAGTSPLHEPAVALARERELGRGDLVIWTDFSFPSLLWNERFSNVLLYHTPSDSDFLGFAERMNAKWIVVTGSWIDAARARPEHWQEVGPAHRHHGPPTIFRRIP